MARIYVSSTVSDLWECSQKVSHELSRIGHDVRCLGYAKGDAGPLDRRLLEVQSCDLYVGLVAFHYGYVPPTAPQNPESKSIVELEYLAARHAKMPTLMFLLAEDAPWPRCHFDGVSGEDPRARRIETFREDLKERGLVRFFHNCDDLAAVVSMDVTRFLGGTAEHSAGQDRGVTRLADTPTKLAAHLQEPQARSSTIFLCYRREDTQDAAGRLHDRLVDTYGRDRVFMDIDSVPLGIDFVEHVTEQIGKCSAVIVMIGKQWQTIKDKKRRRRLDNDDDLVRAEIRAALQQKVPVIPVTVQNAAMPQAEDLPDDIRLLARRNGIDLSATRWTTDVERLIKELDRVMKPSSGS